MTPDAVALAERLVGEEWRAIPGYEGIYEVSSLGQVRSVDRVLLQADGRRRPYKGQNLQLLVFQEGYPKVNLYKRGPRKVAVHQLVALAFLGPCPAGMEVCHNDGVRANNRLSNLRYATRAENHADKRRHGTHNGGVQNHRSKLTESQVRAIREWYRSSNISQRELGELFGVSQTAISSVIRRETYVTCGDSAAIVAHYEGERA